MWMVRACVGLTCCLLLLSAVPAPGLLAGEEKPPTREAEEPELKGEAKKKHDKEVKQILKSLHKEKNRTIAFGRIKELGVQGTRVARDVLMKFVVGNKNQEYVTHSLYALAKIPGKKTVEFLCGKYALRSRDFLVQHEAAGALAKLKDRRAAKPLLEVMTSKRTKIKVVSACVTALAKIAPNDKAAVAAILKLSHDRKDTIRAYAVEALGHVGTDEAFARLTEALEKDKNTRVREYAADGLGKTMRHDALPLLRKALREQTAHTVREACMRAIRKIQGE